MIQNLKITTICQKFSSYNDISINEEFLTKNNLKSISAIHESTTFSPIKKVVIVYNNNHTIYLNTDQECDAFF